jgi:hypothetical protein
MEAAKIGTIIIIESLKDNETKTGSNLYNDVICRYLEYHGNKKKIKHELHIINSKSDFFILLKEIIQNYKSYPSGILLHFEMHGASDKSGLVLSNDSHITWKELQVPFIELNVILDNELYISMATCFGRFLHEAIEFRKKAPFRAFISASKEVSPVQISQSFEAIFEKLAETCDLLMSYCFVMNNEKIFFYHDSREVWKLAIAKTFYDLDNDKEAKAEFDKGIKEDWEKLSKEKKLIPFESMNFEYIKQLVRNNLILETKSNFYFGTAAL